MKNVLGISASPREGGNTELLLGSFLKGAEKENAAAGSIVLNKLNFIPCQECENLGRNEICIIQDDLQELFRKVEEADVLALASPIFFGSLSAQAKMMIDRFQCHWRAEEILKLDLKQKRKKGVFLCVEASGRDEFLRNAKAIVKNFFATVNAEYAGEVFCKGVDEKKAILNRPEVLQEAESLGQALSDG